MPKKSSANSKQTKGGKDPSKQAPADGKQSQLLLPASSSLPLGGEESQTRGLFFGGMGPDHASSDRNNKNVQDKLNFNFSHMTQQRSFTWLNLANQLKLRKSNVDLTDARHLNKECQKEIMVQETGLYKMLEFDLAIYAFAVFQLGLTNLIIFKNNFKLMDADLIVFTLIMLARRILCKANHYYQVNIYRVNLPMFTILRSVPLTIFIVLAWLFIKIAVLNSVINTICLLIPNVMYCIIFGIPMGVFTISTSAFMAHPIYNPEKEKKTSDAANDQDPENQGKSERKDGKLAKSPQQTFVSTSYANRRKNQAAQLAATQSQQEVQKAQASNTSNQQDSNGKSSKTGRVKMDHYYFEFSNMKRYSSAKDELSHILRTIYFNSVEVLYYTGFLPVKFIKQETQLHFDSFMVMVTGLGCLCIILSLLSGHYLRKRAVELQFNAKMCGQWIKVPQPSKTGSVPIQEWRPNTSYPQWTIVSLSQAHYAEYGRSQSNILAQATQNYPGYQSQPFQSQSSSQSDLATGENSGGGGGQNQQAQFQKALSGVSGSQSNSDTKIDYYMSVGTLGNRSQPDDFMAFILYQIFNEPMETMQFIQKFALAILLLQVMYILTLKNKTMVPFQILNFIKCSLYVHAQLIATDDFKRRMEWKKFNAKQVEQLFEQRENQRQVHMLEMKEQERELFAEKKLKKKNEEEPASKQAAGQKQKSYL